MILAALLKTKGLKWIDMGGAEHRDVAGGERYSRGQAANDNIGERILGAYSS